SEGGRVAEVRDGHLADVPLVVHHVRLKVVRRLADRTGRISRAAAERARPVVRHAEQRDARVLVLRDCVREAGRGHGRTETACAYLRSTPVTGTTASDGRAPRGTWSPRPARSCPGTPLSPGARTSRTSRGPSTARRFRASTGLGLYDCRSSRCGTSAARFVVAYYFCH